MDYRLFFSSHESFMVQYSICAPLSVTADGCADTVFQQCVCVPLYTAAECRRSGLVLNTCPARLVGFSPAEEIKRRWDKKLPHGSRLQLKQPHRNSKYHYFPRASIPPHTPSPPVPSFPFTAFKTPTKCTRRALRGLLPLDWAALLLWFPLPSCVRNYDVGFWLSPRCPLTAPDLHRLCCCPTIYGAALRKLRFGAEPLLYSRRRIVSVSDRLGDINSFGDGRIMHGAFSSPQLRTGRETEGKAGHVSFFFFSGHSKKLFEVQEEPLINYYRHHHHP